MEHKEQLEALAKMLDSGMEKVSAQIKENGKANEDTMKELKALALKHEEVAKSLEKSNPAKIQEQLDKIELEMKKYGATGKQDAKSFLLSTQMREFAAKNENKIKGNLKERRNLAFELKEGTIHLMAKAGDMTTSNTFTNDIIEPDRVINFPVYDPNRPVHMRQFMNVGTTSSDSISYPRETAFDDGTASVAEANLIPQSDFDLEQKEAPVRKLAARVDMSSEMLDDVPYLMSYVSRRLMEKLMNKEDNKILYGDGISPNIEGITVEAPFYTDTLASSTVQRWDVLFAATILCRQSEYRANYILLNPTDFQNLLLTKDSEGRYIYPNALSGVPLRINGATVIDNTAITSGDFLVGDFNLGAQLFDRKGATIEFSYENNDNFEKDLVTARIIERIALPIYRPNAFRYGTFAMALASGSA